MTPPLLGQKFFSKPGPGEAYSNVDPWTIFRTIFLGPLFGPFFFTFFGPFFGNNFGLPVGGGGRQTISGQGGVGCSLPLLREGWEADCYYSRRGGRPLCREGWEVVVLVNTTD